VPPAEQAAEKVEKQIPRRPEGLLVMTKQKPRNDAAKAAPLQNAPAAGEIVSCEKAGSTLQNHS
jgi:hypothetical protein